MDLLTGWHDHATKDIHEIEKINDIGIYSSTKLKINIKICSPTSFVTLSRMLSTISISSNINILF